MACGEPLKDQVATDNTPGNLRTKKKRNKVVIPIIAIIATFIVAITIICSLKPRPSSQLIGRWESTNTRYCDMEFLKNGDFFYYSSSSGAFQGAGRWTILEDGRLKLNYDDGDMDLTTFSFKFNGDMLIIDDDNTTYIRQGSVLPVKREEPFVPNYFDTIPVVPPPVE